MGSSHAASGMAAGAAGVAWILPAAGYVVPGGGWSVAVLGTVMAGACLFPDIDSEKATASNAFGPISKGVHHIAATSSRIVTRLTGTRRDETREHRGLTHTIAFAAALFAGISVLGEHWPRQTVAAALAISVACLVRLGARWFVSAPVGVAAGVLLYLASAQIAGPGPRLVALAVALGCVLHCLGDMITKQGVPLLAPIIPIKGKRWWNLRLPTWITFKAGTAPEKVIVAGFMLTTVLAGAAVLGAF